MHTLFAYTFRKSLYTATWGTIDKKQKFPESVEFVPHSHFFLKKEHEVEHEGSTKSKVHSYAKTKYDKSLR